MGARVPSEQQKATAVQRADDLKQAIYSDILRKPCVFEFLHRGRRRKAMAARRKTGR